MAMTEEARSPLGTASRAAAPSQEGQVRLGTGRLAAYGQMILPMSVVGLPLAVYLPAFYGGTLGLNLALVGIVMMVARISDVFTDPLIGHLSDRTRTRWGRRRPWVALGVPVMCVSAAMLFMPPVEVSSVYLLIWISALYLGFTLIGIPYVAWGAELSGDYKERSRITGSREIFMQLGLLLAITAPIIGAALAGDTVSGEAVADAGQQTAASRDSMAALGLLTLVLLPISAIVLFIFVPEPQATTVRTISLRKGLKIAATNGPFRIVLLSTLIGAFAASINAGTALLFFEHVADLGEGGQILILVLFVSALAGAPFWISIGSKISKHGGIAISGAISLAAFALVPVIIYWVKPVAPDMVLWLFLGTAVIQGFASGATPILGASMVADVTDLDALRSGEQRAGFMFAFLGMARKMCEAAGIGLALPFLTFMGFDPTRTDHSGIAEFSLLAVYCLVPLVLWSIAILVIMRYPLTKERQARLRAALERRLARQAGA